MRAAYIVSLGFVTLALLASGCGPTYATGEGVSIKGRVVKGGQPLVVPGRESGTGWVELELFPADESQLGMLATTTAHAEVDGTFVIDYEGRGVPPGQYKLAVYQRSQGQDTDDLQGAFGRDKTTITVAADQSKVGTTIDLGTIELDNAK